MYIHIYIYIYNIYTHKFVPIFGRRLRAAATRQKSEALDV